MSTVITIKDKNVYYAGKVVGQVIEASQDDSGIKALLQITDKRVQRLIGGGAAEFTVTV